jgi:hypothetical protein
MMSDDTEERQLSDLIDVLVPFTLIHPRRRLVFPTRSEFSELIDLADCVTSTASPPDPPWGARNYARPEGVQRTEPAEQCSRDGLRSETSTRCRVNRSPFFRNRVLAPFTPDREPRKSPRRASVRCRGQRQLVLLVFRATIPYRYDTVP